MSRVANAFTGSETVSTHIQKSSQHYTCTIWRSQNTNVMWWQPNIWSQQQWCSTSVQSNLAKGCITAAHLCSYLDLLYMYHHPLWKMWVPRGKYDQTIHAQQWYWLSLPLLWQAVRKMLETFSFFWKTGKPMFTWKMAVKMACLCWDNTTYQNKYGFSRSMLMPLTGSRRNQQWNVQPFWYGQRASGGSAIA